MSRPDLTTPEGVRAYRAELFRVARGWRWSGLALVTLSAVGLVMLAKYDLSWSSMPGRATLAGMVIGWGLVVIGVFARTRYHKRRMAEAEG